MIFAELFYPKELKEAIDDLRAKDDLNEDALKTLNNMPLLYLIMWLIMIVACMLLLYPSLIYSLISVSIITFLLFYYLKVDIARLGNAMMVYKNGEHHHGVVDSVHYKVRSPVAKVKIKESSQGIDIEMGFFSKWYRKDFCPTKGERVYYYSLGSRRCENMPDREEIKRQYCLSKSMLNGAE